MALLEKKNQSQRQALVSISEGMNYRLPKKMFTDGTYVLPPKKEIQKKQRFPWLPLTGTVILLVIMLITLSFLGKLPFTIPLIPHR